MVLLILLLLMRCIFYAVLMVPSSVRVNFIFTELFRWRSVQCIMLYNVKFMPYAELYNESMNYVTGLTSLTFPIGVSESRRRGFHGCDA